MKQITFEGSICKALLPERKCIQWVMEEHAMQSDVYLFSNMLGLLGPIPLQLCIGMPPVNS